MKRGLMAIGGFLLVCGIAGVAVMVTGIVPIKASSGHWGITEWVLDFSKTQSVGTHSSGIKVPQLGHDHLVLQGAGLYETGCRGCHGSPDYPYPVIARHMTPHPPSLPPRLGRWEPEELFYMVKHGILFTGMPAWPAQGREDEVWAIVAFLQVLPELDAESYKQLVHGAPPVRDGQLPDAAPPREELPHVLFQNCARCHGLDGLSRGTGAFPRLAGQSPLYLKTTLEAYGSGQRPSGAMEPIAAALTSDEIRTLAEYFAALPTASSARLDRPPLTDQGAAQIERGRTIAEQGVPESHVPACLDCHGPGKPDRADEYPSLEGQFAPYLVQQLQLFQQGKRGESSQAELMAPVVRRMTDDQMRDVAAYYESLAGGEEAAAESTPAE